MAKEVLLYKLTWPEVKEYLEKNDLILFPTGSTEQHGKQLAEDNDAFTALEVSKRVAEKTGVLVAPVMPFGYSPHHMGFPGSITLPWYACPITCTHACPRAITGRLPTPSSRCARAGETASRS